MNLGDLKDGLLNAGKDKGKDIADEFLDKQTEAGGIIGSVAGLGKGLLGNVFGSGEQGKAEPNETDGADDVAESSEAGNGDDDSSADEPSSESDAPDDEENAENTGDETANTSSDESSSDDEAVMSGDGKESTDSDGDNDSSDDGPEDDDDSDKDKN